MMDERQRPPIAQHGLDLRQIVAQMTTDACAGHDHGPLSIAHRDRVTSRRRTIHPMPRRPPQIRFESWVDPQIREAQEQGAFDNLPGAGKPLPGLDEPYDPLWWVKQKIRDEKLSLLPDALEIRLQLDRALESRTEADLREALTALNARIAHLNARVVEGPPTTLAPVDIEAAVQRWRRE
jgi:hypothetical protein